MTQRSWTRCKCSAGLSIAIAIVLPCSRVGGPGILMVGASRGISGAVLTSMTRLCRSRSRLVERKKTRAPKNFYSDVMVACLVWWGMLGMKVVCTTPTPHLGHLDRNPLDVWESLVRSNIDQK